MGFKILSAISVFLESIIAKFKQKTLSDYLTTNDIRLMGCPDFNIPYSFKMLLVMKYVRLHLLQKDYKRAHDIIMECSKMGNWTDNNLIRKGFTV